MTKIFFSSPKNFWRGKIKKYCLGQKGASTALLLMFIAFLLAIEVAIISQSFMATKLAKHKAKKESAFQIAEAGINYYRWHLAHNPNDYKDGHAGDSLNGDGKYGPYTHNYYDPDGALLGTFSLEITPPNSGSTVATIESKGIAYSSPNMNRVLAVRVGRRSLTEYSFLSNTPIWIGDTETVSGPLHSNGGIRFDGTTNAKVTSAKATYDCSSAGHDCTGIKPGIWGAGGPPSYWQFPVPVIDFAGITSDFSQMKDAAQASGLYLAGSPKGYHIVFQSNGKFNIYKITNLANAVSRVNDDYTAFINVREQISTESLFMGNQSIPSNHLIFIEDNIWVDGTVNGQVTLVAAKLPDNPAQYKTITINGDIHYLARDGNHSLGLMAQGSIIVPRYAPTNLTIDASLLSQNRHVWRPLYGSRLVKTSIEVYGGVITNQFWTWSYVNGSGVTVDGYQNTNTIYNNYLTFNPPPFFPTTGTYEIISWQEL